MSSSATRHILSGARSKRKGRSSCSICGKTPAKSSGDWWLADLCSKHMRMYRKQRKR